MRSNWQLWDFSRSHPQLVDIDKKGCYSVWSFDPYIERLLLESVPHDIVGPFKTVLGNEVTPDWIQENLNTVTLFGENDSYLILMGENIPSRSKKLLIDISKGTQETYFLIAFSKASSLFDQLAKCDHWNCFKIDAPKFWEQGKLFNYLCQHLDVRLTYELQNFILENVDPTPGSYVNCLNNLKMHLGETRILELESVKSIITQVRFDKFKLAKLFGQKKFGVCYEALLKLELDYSLLEDWFSFMPSYLVNLADPSIIAKKGYKSKYDKEILSLSKLWKADEIQTQIELFGDLLILARRRDPLLKDALRQSYLSQF